MKQKRFPKSEIKELPPKRVTFQKRFVLALLKLGYRGNQKTKSLKNRRSVYRCYTIAYDICSFRVLFTHFQNNR